MQVDVKFKWKTLELYKKDKYRKSIAPRKYRLFNDIHDKTNRAWFDLYTALATNRKLYKLKHRKLNGINN